jgi:hypothetical protein
MQQQVIFPVYEWSVQAMTVMSSTNNTAKSTAARTATATNSSTTLHQSHKLATADHML